MKSTAQSVFRGSKSTIPKSIPRLDRGWEPVFGKDQAQAKGPMSIDAASTFVRAMPQPPAGLTRRGLLKSGLGLAGIAGLVMPSTAAYAAMEAVSYTHL